MNPARIFGLMAATLACVPEGASAAVIGHTPPKPEGKGVPVPKQRHAGGCNSAGCRTLDRCICDCKQCKHQCNGQ